jgi:hypothetical protein
VWSEGLSFEESNLPFQCAVRVLDSERGQGRTGQRAPHPVRTVHVA